MKRPTGMPEPSGIASKNDDPYPCDDCGKYIPAGRPFWGGGLDYFGEANNVYCERCEIARFKNVEKMIADDRAKFLELKQSR